MVICKATMHGAGVQNKPLTSGAFSFLLRGTISSAGGELTSMRTEHRSDA